MQGDFRNLTLEDAWRVIREQFTMLGSEDVSVPQAYGRILRCAVVSDIDYPSATISSADGYCLRATSTSGATSADPVVLTVAATITAGTCASLELGEGECAKVTTGAVLPLGTDAVVAVEEVEARQDAIVVTSPVAAGGHVRRKGEVAGAGQVVMRAGELVTPGHLAVLASLQSGPVTVSSQPTVGVVVTGDELIDYADSPGPGCVRSSNGAMLGGLLRSRGLEVRNGGISSDCGEDLIRHLNRLAGCDVVVVSGGMGAGERDFTADTLERMGAAVIIRGLRMRPGRHMALAGLDERFCFCLPGSPVGCFILFHLIVWPSLLMMMGCRTAFPRPVKARWGGAPLEIAGDRTVMLATLEPDLVVRPMESHGSGDVLSIAGANCLASVQDGARPTTQGQAVEVFTLGSPW
jgi:molybdopterin molybdotransferase